MKYKMKNEGKDIGLKRKLTHADIARTSPSNLISYTNLIQLNAQRLHLNKLSRKKIR